LTQLILNANINDVLARYQTADRIERIDARGARRDEIICVRWQSIDRPLLCRVFLPITLDREYCRIDPSMNVISSTTSRLRWNLSFLLGSRRLRRALVIKFKASSGIKSVHMYEDW